MFCAYHSADPGQWVRMPYYLLWFFQFVILLNRHRRTNIFWPFSSRFISSRFMKSWSVTVKTVWYLKLAGQTVKTVRSNGQNRQISRDWAILVLLVSSTLKRDKQKYARSFKKKRDERDLTVRRSNDDRPPVPASEQKSITAFLKNLMYPC